MRKETEGNVRCQLGIHYAHDCIIVVVDLNIDKEFQSLVGHANKQSKDRLMTCTHIVAKHAMQCNATNHACTTTTQPTILYMRGLVVTPLHGVDAAQTGRMSTHLPGCGVGGGG